MNELQSFWNTLTPEQQEQIKQSTTQDWIDAIVQCSKILISGNEWLLPSLKV
jgi:hypothetical protein